jgi:hypothetical protein
MKEDEKIDCSIRSCNTCVSDAKNDCCEEYSSVDTIQVTNAVTTTSIEDCEFILLTEELRIQRRTTVGEADTDGILP